MQSTMDRDASSSRPVSSQSPADDRLTWRGDVFSSFKKESLGIFNDDYGDMLVRLGTEELDMNNNERQFDPTIDTFVKNYRMLPIAARAKLENWSINADDIKMIQTSCPLLNCSKVLPL